MLAIVLGGLPERVHLHLASSLYHGREVLRGRGRVLEEAQVGQLTGAVKLTRLHLPGGVVVKPFLDVSGELPAHVR